MYKHASMNRAFRLIWNEALNTWIPVAEIARGRRKRSRRATLLLAMLGLHALEAGAAPPTPTELPTGGQVVAGAANIAQHTEQGTAVLNIDQSTQRAVIDWTTFNVGSDAQVNFNQPGQNAATLNRVLDSNPSQIFGRITATGQVFITNASGVYFGKTASVDVGGLVATTHDIGNADFMAGNLKFDRNGASGSVVNDGELTATLGGYIALLAPEVRNNGVIVARLGTVALAAGESFTLKFDENRLASITVEPSSIAALVENKSAVMAPGGVIILSAKAVDSLQGGVVRNTGTLEATGLSMQGGRIVLEANGSIENSGTINANAGVDGSPSGNVTLDAPVVINTGTISAASAPQLAPVADSVVGGSIAITADTFEQSASGRLDVSGLAGGSVAIDAAKDITVAGVISAAASPSAPASEAGGTVVITAGQDITLASALIDASGAASGGHVVVSGGTPLPFTPPTELPTVALIGATEIRTSSRRGRGGSVTVTGGRIGMFDASAVDATGATGGGDVFVGGGFHGTDPSIDNAYQVVIGTHASIDASATESGDAGDVAVWADGYTTFGGSISARGGATSGDGGFVEVSGKERLDFLGTVDARAERGQGGTLLLDPKNITVDAGGGAAIGDVSTFATNAGGNSIIAPSVITGIANGGTAVTLQANNDITINSAIVTNNAGGVGGTLTFQAGRNIEVNANIDSDDGNIVFIANDPLANGANRDPGNAYFDNASLIDAGAGSVSITLGAQGASAGISTGQLTAASLTVVHNGPTVGGGDIDLGETNVTGAMNLSSNSSRNVTNLLGDIISRGTLTINVGAGDVTINRATTDLNIVALTNARNVLLVDQTAMRFGTSNISGSLNATTTGPIGSTGAVQVTGTTTLTANTGGFGFADPYIELTNAANNFVGSVSLNVPSTGTTATGGYATIRDSNAITIATANTATALQIQAGGAITTSTITAGTNVTLSTSTGAIDMNSTTAGSNITATTSNGAIDMNVTGAGGTVTATTSNGRVDLNTTTAAHLTVTATGTVDVGPTTLSGDLTISTNNTITDSGTIAVRQAVLTAGSTNDIVFDQTLNNFNSMRIVSARDATIVDQNALNFGSWDSNQGGATTHVYGNLSVQAGGDITQSRYTNQDNYSRILVDGTSLFTANHASAQIGFYLGANDALTGDGNVIGQQNNFAGTITLARTHGNTGFDDVQLRNVNTGASVLSGLTAVGTLNNVSLRFDAAPSVELPGMTVTGTLRVYAPGVVNTAGVPTNIISQSGAIVVTGATIVAAGTTGDIVLDNAGNNFSQFGVANTGARNLTVRDLDGIVLFANGYHQAVSGNLTVTAGGNITDAGNNWDISAGTITFDAGASDISFGVNSNAAMNRVVVTQANNVTIGPRNSVILGNVNATGTLTVDSRNGGSLTQLAATAVNAGGVTTLNDFNSGGITLSQTNNVLGALAINNAASVTIRENDAITQQSAWTNVTVSAINLTTSNDQAITLNFNNYFGALTLTQVNDGATSAGAVLVRENADGLNGMTQGSAWTVHGTTTLDSGVTLINFNNQNNIFGPLQVTGATGNTNSLPSTITIYARNTATTNAITDVGGTGAWNTGTGVVKLVAYNTAGTTAGGGNVILTNTGNVLGDLLIRATDVTITENDNITDGASAIWNPSNDSGWNTTGALTLVVANATGKSVTLDNLNNVLGPIGLSTTGTAGTLTNVLITDASNLTQSSAWLIGAAPVTLDARTNQIDLSSYDNVLGAITLSTANGTPTSVSIRENDAITQGNVWALTGVPVTLNARNGNAIAITNASNVMGNLTLTGGATSITENDDITQGGAWTTTGTTTLTTAARTIVLQNANNVLGDIAISGTPTDVRITENDDITQASAWVQPTTPFILNAGAHDLILTQATNRLGDLTVIAANASVTENDALGISDGSAWNVSGLTTLTAGAGNPIVLNANPASNFGTLRIVSASSADVTDIDGIILDTSTIASGGILTVSAGGEITQIGALTTPSLRLIGTGFATLNNVSNNVQNLAAGFSGGDLQFVNAGSFAIAVVGGTSGVTISANDVTMQSVSGTITGLSMINASSTSLTLTTGTALALPQMNIAGAQSYTASTVSGAGIAVGGNVTSTAAGAIDFNSAVTLGADLAIQSTNSNINFHGTLAGGSNQLTVNAGSGLVDFDGAVSGLGNTIDAGAALSLTSTGANFDSTLGANNGLAITGPVVFRDTVTLANGNAASVFTGLVTLGRVGGMDLSGYDGMTFNDGILLQNGSATINSNNSPLTFQTSGSVSGPYDLTLNSGTALLLGLDRMGANLTSLTVTALNPTIPSGGVSIAGAQTYTATNSSNITLNGNVTSTAAGAITFNSPVTVGADSTITSTDSAIVFGATVDGAHDLTVDSGAGAVTFTGAVGGVAPLGDGTGAALILQGSGATTFNSTVQARSGMTSLGNVTFNNNVTLSNGNTGSTFNGLVTSGGASGNTISGFDNLTFNGGLALVGGPINVVSNGSTIHFGGAVTGPQNLALNALAAGAGTVTGLDQIGFASNLTRLDVTAQTLSLPTTGLAVAGPMNFTAAGGITLNGAVGNNATGRIDFNGPVTLATGAITVTSDDDAVNFAGTVNGGQALTVNAGSGTTTFGAAVGAGTALSSVTTDAGGTTAINGGSLRTTGAQIYNDAVTLGADATLTGVDIEFLGTLNGARSLVVNNSGPTVFGGVVGGNAALTSITTDAPGTVVVNTTAVTTTGSQTYNENMTLGSNVVFTGVGLTFDDIDGAHTLTANAGTGALNVGGSIGATTPVSSFVASGSSIAVDDVTSTGAQSYTATGGITLNGALSTTNSAVTVTGPTTLGDDAAISTTGGAITFAGSTSTINGAHDLTLAAGSGNVVLGGVVGGTAPLSALTVTGNNITLPNIATVNDLNQTYTALGNITLSQSRTVNAPISFIADSDNDGTGSFILLNGVSLTASNNTLAIQAADLDMQGNSTMSSGSGLMTIFATNGRNILLGVGGDAAGQMTITGAELSRMSSSGGLRLTTSDAGWIHVNGITASQSQNITGALELHAQDTGDVSFLGSTSTFNGVRAEATGGDINIGVNLNTSNDPIQFVTGVNVSGASTISSGGGDISFDSTLDVDNDLAITTGNGVLTFGGAVGSNRTLVLNLGGGSVNGLGQLQNTLTGLTVNGTAGITLPTFTINGPQVYNTGPITVTGNLGGVGITFNNVVDVVPAIGTAITIDSGTGTLNFTNLASFNAIDMTLIGDEINFTRPVTGSGSLALRPYTNTRNISVGGSGAPIVGLNLTAAELAWLPIGTLSGLTIGSASGTGSLDMAGVLNAPGTPLTLNGGGGITQSGGSITSGTLQLYAAGNGISLASATNSFGAIGITGSPTSLNLANTRDITQLGAAAWALGTANVTLSASGAHDIVLNNVGNTFGTLSLTGRNAQVTEAAATDIGATTLSGNLTATSAGAIHVSGALAATGNVAFTSTDVVTQSAAMTIGGNLDIVTSVNAGDVTIDNSGATSTTIGNTLVGGDYELIATGDPVSQAAGTSLQIRGDLTVTGASIVLGGAGNLIGGSTTLPATNTTLLRQSGVITLGNRTESGNLTVISERTNRFFVGAEVNGDAVVLDNAANNIGGRISVTASAPTIGTGADVQTGINQSAGTSIAVTGVASFTAEASGAGSLGIDLTNAGNSFGTLAVSGTTVNVRNSAVGTTTIQSASASTALTLTAVGAVAQTGAIITPTLTVNTTGAITLDNAGNSAASIAMSSGGNDISYTDVDSVAVTALNAAGADVSLTAGGSGNLTQSAALLGVDSLSANAGGAVILSNAANAIGSLAASSAGTGFQVLDTAGLVVTGIVRTTTGDVSVRTGGDLTLNSGSRLQADAGNVVASTEGAGNFINNAGASALVAGSGNRWLVYSNAPDLAAGAHTIKGGLTSSFRHYGATYGSYAPGSVTESGNGFIYSAAAPTLTVSAIVAGAATHVYGDTPTGTLAVSISSGLIDSEDNVGNILTGGTATFSDTLANTMDAGTYSISYVGGLTSVYSLVADPTGATYTVTPATLTYTANAASRIYGAANPALSGSISGFRLGQNASVLSGAAVWSTTATATSNAGQYAITGSGYTVGSNYSFAQAAGNATALTIGRAGLTVTANNDSRVYNGTGYTGGAGVTFSAFANGQDATALGGTLTYGGSSQGARNVGNYVLSASGLTSTNYDIAYVAGSLAISAADLTLTSANVIKAYDGTLSALGTAAVATGSQLFGTDSLTGGTFGFTNANAGTGNRTVTVSGVTVNDGNGGGNYNVSYASNTTSTINPANIVIGTSNVTRTYDGTLGASGTATVVSGALYSNASNGNAQDTLSGGTFAFTDRNVGAGNRRVTTSGVTITDGNGGGNYAVTYADNTTSTINAASLIFSGTIASRQYDGTTAAALSGYMLTGLVGSETLGATIGSATFADANAGGGKAVSINGVALVDGTNGGLASNYVVSPTALTTGNITPRLLTLDAVVADRVYDGTTNATLQSFGLSGFVGSETVDGVFTGSASFLDKHVGDDKGITITGINLVDGTNGGLAGNYAAPTSASSSASITPASLHVAGVVALDKVYDGTAIANLDTQGATVSGRFGSDDVQISAINGTFLDKNVGTDKQIGAGTVVLSGADAGDYVLIQPTHLTASITARELVVSATGIDRVYDGTRAASVNLLDNRVSGDLLSLTSTNAFIDKNAGSGKYINVSGIAIDGADAGNYFVNQSTGTFASITRASLPVSVVGIDRTYDGTRNASVSITGNPLAGDDVEFVFGAASFADPYAGTDKVISVSGLTLLGADAGNYSVDIVGTPTANIAPGRNMPEPQSQAAGTWTLIPAMPSPIATTQPVAPTSLLDLTPPTLPVRRSGNGSGAGANVTNGASNAGAVRSNVETTPPAARSNVETSAPAARSNVESSTPAVRVESDGNQVTVAIVHAPIGMYPGRIAVRVPRTIIASGQGFSFALPASLAEAAGTDEVFVSMAGDKPLPSWLNYVAATKTFVATTPPAGALPFDVLVQIGGKRWMMTLIEKTN